MDRSPAGLAARGVVLLPVLVSAGALGVAAAAGALAGVLALAAVALAVVGPRWELDTGRQWVTCAMGGGAGYAAAAILHEPLANALGEGWTRVGAVAVAAAATRLIIIAPRGGATGTVAMAFAGLVAAGETRGRGYIWFVALFLATAAAALRYRPDAGQGEAAGTGGSRTATRWSRATVAGLIVVVAAGLGVATTAGVQRAHAYLTTRARSSAYSWRPKVGFSDKMDLGALDGLLDSDEIVLRIRGPHVDYLRGAVLDLYEAGRWVRSSKGELAVPADFDAVGGSAPEVASPVGEVGGAVVVSAVAERTNRFFLPRDARDVSTTPGAVLLDDLGAVKRASDRAVVQARFVAGPRTRAPLAAPRAIDRHVPRRLQSVLGPLAAIWTAGATTSGEKLEAIERHLRTEYAYARAFQRRPPLDPVIDFLTTDKRGHCEYFATALALLARSAGIPARVVMGYRVGEQSPFGYDVVRERNAHAWVEAWTDGEGWATRDATPSEALPQNRAHVGRYAASALDALRVAYDDVTSWLGRLSVAETAVAWLVGSLVLGFIVARGARRARAAPGQADELPLPALRALLVRAAREGHIHRGDEPLEHFAARWAEPRAADLLLRYAELRYGHGRDDAAIDALARDIAAFTRDRRRAGAAP